MMNRYYNPFNILVLYRNSEYALSWMVDFFCRNKDIIKSMEHGRNGLRYKVDIRLEDGSLITLLRYSYARPAFHFLEGMKFNRIYLDSAIPLNKEERAQLDTFIEQNNIIEEKFQWEP